MEQWLNALPALAYVKYLHSWLVVNHNSEPISWTDDAVEVCCGQHSQAAAEVAF